MIARLNKILICFILGIIPILHTGNLIVTAETEVSIAVPILNVREGPGLSFNVKAKAKEGERYSVLDQQQDWIKLKLQNGDTGWVASWFTTALQEKQPSNPSATGEVTADILNIRSEPTTESQIIGKLKKGTTIKILEEKNEWYRIILSDQKEGWVAGWLVSKDEKQLEKDDNEKIEQKETEEFITVLYDGTNIRTGPSTSDQIVMRANNGNTFPIISTEGDWFKIKLPNNQIGYIAGWIVKPSNSATIIQHDGIEAYLRDKTIVLDPGHGGRDGGTIGANGTLEKNLTMQTAKLVYEKLKATGANVILTRNEDNYISLQSRVSTSHYHNADAFISIHYNSSIYPFVRGASTFYYYSKNKQLAQDIQNQIVKNTGFIDRKIQFGNYQVIRENKQPSILIEFGFLSNSAEELAIKTSSYQEKAANSVYYGLAQYFKK